MLEDQLNAITGGECNVVIGQGIRGDVGVTAVEQIYILSSLRDATNALDDVLSTAMTLSGKSSSRTVSGSG